MPDSLKPPSAILAWAALLGLIAAVAAGSYSYGTLSNRVNVLESYSPLSVDRRLTVIEQQMNEVVMRLRGQDRRDPSTPR